MDSNGMSEKQKRPYDWKEAYKNERESSKKWRIFGKTILAATLIAGGLSMTNSDNRADALKYINDLLHPQNKTEISIDNPNVIASDVIAIDKDETLAVEATESVEKMAAERGIDKEAIPYQQIQEESRNAQYENNEQHVTFPGDQYEAKLIEHPDDKIEVSIDPLDKFKLK